MADPTRNLILALSVALKRIRNPWNWSIRRLGILFLCLALGLKSFLFFATGTIAVAISLFELHMVEMKNRHVWRLMRIERDWLEADWSSRKRIQTIVLILLALLLLWSLAVDDLALIMLAIVGATMLCVEAVQHAVPTDDIEEDEAERVDESADEEETTGEDPEESRDDSWLQ